MVNIWHDLSGCLLTVMVEPKISSAYNVPYQRIANYQVTFFNEILKTLILRLENRMLYFHEKAKTYYFTLLTKLQLKLVVRVPGVLRL